jgi:translation initiation factor 1
MNDWKKRLGIVYSTNPDYHYREEEKVQGETIPKEKQQLRIYLDKRNRKGKAVTLVTGFRGTEEELQALGRLLKMRCGVGGSVKNGEIIVQGDHREKVLNILLQEGYAKATIL